jgi:hypothetical protein
MTEYQTEHPRILTDQRGRAPSLLRIIESSPHSWTAEQVLVDSEGHNDWVACFEVDLEQSARDARAVIRMTDLRSL